MNTVVRPWLSVTVLSLFINVLIILSPASTFATVEKNPVAQSSINFGEVIETVRHYISPTTESDKVLGVESRLYKARFAEQGFSLALREHLSDEQLNVKARQWLKSQSVDAPSLPPPQAFGFNEHADFSVTTRNIYLGNTPIQLETGTWQSEFNYAMRRLTPNLIERVTARDGEVEWDFVLEEPLTQNKRLRIEAFIEGHLNDKTITEVDNTLRFPLASGRLIRMSELIVLDANNDEIYRTLPIAEENKILLEIPAEILASNHYPITIDPVISVEYPVSEPVYVESRQSASTPSIAYNREPLDPADRNYLVVWSDGRGFSGGSAFDIYGTRVDETGVILDPPGIAISTAAGNQQFPTVASNGFGYFVVWSDSSGSDNDIYGARVTSTGILVDSPPETGAFPISTAIGDQTEPDVAFNEGATVAGYLVVWRDRRFDPGTDIYGARVNNAGLVFGTNGIAISSSGSAFSPAVESDGNDFLVVWTDGRSGVDNDIYGAKVSASGIVQQPDGIAINTAAGHQGRPDVAAAVGGYYFIAWDTIIDDQFDIFGNRMGPFEILLDGAAGMAVSTAPGSQTTPAVAAREDPFASQKDFLVAWQYINNGRDINATRINQVGDLLDGPADAGGIPIATSRGDQINVTAYWGETGYLLAWSDESNRQIHAARVDVGGNLLDAPPDGGSINLILTAIEQSDPAISWDGTNYMVLWRERKRDNIDAGFDIYGARITPNGTLLDGTGIAVATSDNNEGPPAVAWDGASYLAVWSNQGINIMGTRIAPSGVLLDGPPDTGGIVIGENPLTQIDPALAWNGSNYLVVWTEYEKIGTTCLPPIFTCSYLNENLHGSLVSPDGSVTRSDFNVATSLTQTPENPAVASDGENYLVVWEACAADSSVALCFDVDDIRARRFDAGGFSLDDSVAGNGTLISNASGVLGPQAAWGDASYLIAWSDTRGGTSRDIYGARLSNTGTLLDGPPDGTGGIAISTAADTQMFPVIGTDGQNAIVGWQDRRSGTNFDVYGARVNSAGELIDGPADTGGIPLAMTSSDETSPAIIGDNGRVAVAYNRVAPEALYGTSDRLFMRIATFEADLSVTKSDLSDPVAAGGILTYDIQITNAGPAEATGIQITDTLPVNTSFVSATPDQGSCSESAGTVTCDLGTLAASGSTGVQLVLTANALGSVSNTVEATANELDPNLANNTATAGTTVVPGADLSVTKVALPDPAVMGQALTYTLTVNNNGPENANNVVLFDVLPTFVTLNSMSASQGICQNIVILVRCNLGTIAVGTSATVTINVTPQSVTTLTNEVDVASSEPDPDETNNTASVITDVYDPSWAELQVEKTDSPDPLFAGDELTYTLIVTNNGPAGASDVQLQDSLPDRVNVQSIVASQGNCVFNAPVINCGLGTVAVNTSAVVTIIVTPIDAGDRINSVSVSAAETDPVPANNTATAITTVNALTDTDGDTVFDHLDNCTLIGNTDQRDTDNDGYGNACDPDFDNNLIVNASDLAFFKTKFFTSDPDADLNGDGVVNAADLATLKIFFFKPPGPSALVP